MIILIVTLLLAVILLITIQFTWHLIAYIKACQEAKRRINQVLEAAFKETMDKYFPGWNDEDDNNNNDKGEDQK